MVEILPAENENNYKYLYEIKRMAESAGLNYYAKEPWRKRKKSEDIMFFVKGKARPLCTDKQRG